MLDVKMTDQFAGHEIARLWLSQVTMRDWMNMGLNCQQWQVCTNFRGGLLHRRWRTEVNEWSR